MNPKNSAVPFEVEVVKAPSARLITVDGEKHIYDNGVVAYYVGDKLHRPDGPAIVHPTGYMEWHVDGKLIQVRFQDGSFLNDTPVLMP